MRNFLGNAVRHLKSPFARGALILVYHRISESILDPWSLSVKPEHFAEHLDVLRRSFHPKSLQEITRSLQSGTKLNHKSIVITFDDGYADNLYAALPLLERFDVPATIFLVSGMIGSMHEFWWDELSSLLLKPLPLPEQLDLSINERDYSWQLGEAAEYQEADYARDCNWRAAQPVPSLRHVLYMQLWQLIHPLSSENQEEVLHELRAWARQASHSDRHRILNQEECVQLAQGKGIEIGAHTIHHSSLASLPIDGQRNEILGSKACLEGILGTPVKAFSYPFGKRHDYSSETVAMVQEAGFSVACCNMSGVIDTTVDLFQLPRIHIHDCDGDEFEGRLLSKFYA